MKVDRRGWAFSILVTVCLASTSQRTNAQGLGAIVGSVTDPSGGAVPGASVQVISETKGLFRQAIANAQGYYVVPSLAPDVYDINVQAGGFATFVRNGITLQADQNLTVNVGLTLAKVSQQVNVSETAVQVDTTTATLNEVVDQRRIEDLPLNGRNAAALALLAPGATQAPPNNSDQGIYKTFPSVVPLSVNGSRNNQTSFNMDGNTNNDNYTNVNQPFPFPDALQEFSVQTSNYSARYGGNSGAVVNIVTKSGSNNLHGDLFEFNRNAVFNARNFFASKRDPLKRNQFGGTIGGPIVIPGVYHGKDKTFFSFGYQGTRIRTASERTTFVPTLANQAGNFSALLSATNPDNPFGRVVVINDPLAAQPFPDNMIPSTSFDPAAVAFFKYLPSVGGNGLVRFSQPSRQDFNAILARVDHSISNKDRLTARYYLDRFTNQAFLDPANYVNAVSGSHIDSHNALLSETHIVRSSLLNEVRLGFSRVESVGGPPPNTIGIGDLGVKIYQPTYYPKSIDGLNLSGYFNVSDFPPAFFTRNNYNVSDDISWVRGRHNIAVGVSYQRGQVMLRDGFRAYGSFGFTPDYTNNSAASFLLGKVRSLSQGSGEYKDNLDNYLGLYLQDDFHVASRLTLNLGIRYEPFFPWHETRGRVEQFRVSDYSAGVRSRMFLNAPPGLLFPGDPGMPPYGVTGTYNDFAPRVGFAYDVFGSGRSSIRGGVGIFYDAQQIGIINNRFVNVTPFSTQVSLTDPKGPFSDPYLGLTNPFPAPNPPPNDIAFPTPVLTVTYDPRDNAKMAVPVTYNWNLSVEQQIRGDWMLRVGYVGSRSRHQTETIELNPAVYTPGSKLSTDARRLFQPYGSIGQASQDLNSNYNSLQASLQHRLAHGVTLLANYTYSKSLDDVPYGQGNAGIASQNDSPIPWYLPGRHQMDYGRSDFDHTHRLVLSYVWQLPGLRDRDKYIRSVFGHWEITGIVTVQSGGPLTVLAGKDQSQTGLGQDRAVLVGQPKRSGACGNVAPCVDFLSRSSLVLPDAGQFGNVGKGFISGPNFTTWDMGFFKVIPLTSERYRLQFRAEFFNIFNRVNFSNPNVSVSSAGFGQIRDASDPRIGQLALKLFF